jgi:N-dimethylarginine dimethylaminohydrolase
MTLPAFVASGVYAAEKVDFTVSALRDRTEPLSVLLCNPAHFDIVDVKNAYMEGQQGKLDKQLAVEQWEQLKQLYLELKEEGVISEVHVIDGAAGCEDMVFCANQTFPWLQEGKKLVVMSKMRHASRQKEVPYFEEYFKKLGYESIHLQKAAMFEGMGDTIPHPGKRLLYGGFGHRTDASAFEELSGLLNLPVVVLELVHPSFYHLDTCFLPLSESAVMICAEAFTPHGLRAIRKLFSKVYEIPYEEAVRTFCLNAHVISNPNGKKAAVIQKGSKAALEALKSHGYSIHEVDTSEFMKSGGSVFCMKMMIY